MTQYRKLKARQEPLDTTIGFRVFPSERAMTEDLAEHYGIRISDACRVIYRKGLEALKESRELTV